MKILITGGAGFIGAHVAKALLEQGDEVVILDDFNDFLYSSDLKKLRLKEVINSAQVKVVEGSILDEALLKQVFQENEIDAVIHLAALANPAYSLGAGHEYTQVNVLGTLNILQAASAAAVKRFIFAGSSSVYNDTQTPFREDAYPLEPRSIYGASKAAAELYCKMWAQQAKLPITVLRFFSVYGPWGRPDMAGLIFTQRILNNLPIQVNEEDRFRDFTYIDDVVQGVLAALKLDSQYEVINLGNGKPVSVRALVAAIETAADKKAVIETRPVPPGEMHTTFADIAKAKKLLGYDPKIAVEEGAARTVEWVKQWQDKVDLSPSKK